VTGGARLFAEPTTRHGRYDRNNPEHRHLVTSLFMTASDVNSVTKPWDVAVGVTKSLFTEFFMQARCCDGVLVVRQHPAADLRGAGAPSVDSRLQGDEERAMGLQPIVMMDRTKANVPQQQLSFIGPCWTACTCGNRSLATLTPIWH